MSLDEKLLGSRIQRGLLSVAISMALVGAGLFFVSQITKPALSGNSAEPNATLPDLAVSGHDIAFSDDNPLDGDVIEICATIHNIGNGTSLEVRTDFYDHYKGSSVLINITWIREIPPGENKTTCTPWVAHPAGLHGILVKVDPENKIEEFREDNNVADRAIEVQPRVDLLPDLTIDGGIHFSNNHPKEGDKIKICVTVVNVGDAAADHIEVRFVVIFKGLSSLIGTTFITHLDPGAWAETCVEWTAKPAGLHTIVVFVDPENRITESNEHNNVEDASISVDPAEIDKLHIFLSRFDNDGNGRLDDVVIVVYGPEHNSIVGAEVYIDGEFYGRTPDSGTILAYNFSAGWHVVKVHFNGQDAMVEFFSQG